MDFGPQSRDIAIGFANCFRTDSAEVIRQDQQQSNSGFDVPFGSWFADAFGVFFGGAILLFRRSRDRYSTCSPRWNTVADRSHVHCMERGFRFPLS